MTTHADGRDNRRGRPHPATMDDEEQIRGVLDFWRTAGGHGNWFSHRPAFDVEFRSRFLDLHLAAARRELDHWAETADGALASLILLDQFPRNAFRGTAHMYATDPLALDVARPMVDRGWERRVDPDMRLFCALPFAHSENLADQDISVRLNVPLGGDAAAHARGHRDIIRRFGRFPHRNVILGRTSTAEELEFLAAGGFAG